MSAKITRHWRLTHGTEGKRLGEKLDDGDGGGWAEERRLGRNFVFEFHIGIASILVFCRSSFCALVVCAFVL